MSYSCPRGRDREGGSSGVQEVVVTCSIRCQRIHTWRDHERNSNCQQGTVGVNIIASAQTQR